MSSFIPSSLLTEDFIILVLPMTNMLATNRTPVIHGKSAVFLLSNISPTVSEVWADGQAWHSSY